MTQGYTLRIRPPGEMMSEVSDDGAVPVTAWSFVRVRGARDTWHLIGTRRGEPWVSSEITAFSPLAVRTAREHAYNLTSPGCDPTPEMLMVLHASLRSWGVPRTEITVAR